MIRKATEVDMEGIVAVFKETFSDKAFFIAMREEFESHIDP